MWWCGALLCGALLLMPASAIGAQERLPDGTRVPDPPPEKPAQARVVRPFPGLVVRPDEHIVEIEAEVCLDAGWLEQVACAPASREHESLMVVRPEPSHVHAALLLAGFKSGKPGRWIYEGDTVRTEPPTGDRVDLFVRYENENGETVERPVRDWIRDRNGKHEFPDTPWVFGGSGFAPNPEWMEEEGEYYIADQTGSIIGLVTFGDEVLGFAEVIADREAVQPPEWEVNTDAIPAIGTKVTIVVKAHGEDAAKEDAEINEMGVSGADPV